MEKIVYINDNFTTEGLTDFLIKTYHLKGYSVIVNKFGQSIQLDIAKNTNGLLSILGMSQGIKVTYSVTSPNILSVIFSDGKWVDKIIVAAIGMVCCGSIPTITAAIGAFCQYSLPNNIMENINIFIISNQ